jgi:hypothetical protein
MISLLSRECFCFNIHDDIDDKSFGGFLSNRMEHGRRSTKKPSYKVKKERFQNRQGWIQTLGGLTVLSVIPALTVLCLSPDVHAWVRASISAHFQSKNRVQATKDTGISRMIKQYRLPDSISKIAEISEVQTDISKEASTQPSDLSRAILRLHRALQAHPSWKTKDVFHAANEKESMAKNSPCPFERIDGEQSVVLSNGEHGNVSLVRTLNRCAEAVEQVTIRGRSAY